MSGCRPWSTTSRLGRFAPREAVGRDRREHVGALWSAVSGVVHAVSRRRRYAAPSARRRQRRRSGIRKRRARRLGGESHSGLGIPGGGVGGQRAEDSGGPIVVVVGASGMAVSGQDLRYYMRSVPAPTGTTSGVTAPHTPLRRALSDQRASGAGRVSVSGGASMAGVSSLIQAMPRVDGDGMGQVHLKAAPCGHWSTTNTCASAPGSARQVPPVA